ncbi:hypothetical protein A0O36_01965 [Piscirickettsiaceae bacterium NZ-RLO1]|nr:hypothetical protein A0O36_01965 [Piscirickettsiaceae bacterium NZ-RLO1]
MIVEELTVENLLARNRLYRIPYYQRPYSWEKEHTVALINDIYESYTDDHSNEPYFVGCMVSIKTDENIYEVVDGQQRLITLTVIISKLADLISKDKVKAHLKDICCPESFDEKNPIIEVKLADKKIYNDYILKGLKRSPSSKYTKSELRYFRNSNSIEEYLNETVKDEKELIDLSKYLCRNVKIAHVSSEDISASFRMFNVLNTRGMSLTQSDLLKNQICQFAGLKKDDVILVQSVWDMIEEYIGKEKLDEFLAIYQISQKYTKDRSILKETDFHKYLYIDVFEKDLSNYLNEFLAAAKLYHELVNGSYLCEEIQRECNILFHLKTDREWLSPILSILFRNRNQNRDSIPKEKLIVLVKTFLRTYFHEWILESSKLIREKITFHFIKEINKGKDFEGLMKILYGYAKNEKIMDQIEHIEYTGTKSNVNFLRTLLLKIEDELNDASVHKIYHGTIHIEHVLPQKLGKGWSISPKDHAKYVQKIGNLTLLSVKKNISASNKSFENKQKAYNFDKNVSFDLTKEIISQKNGMLNA